MTYGEGIGNLQSSYRGICSEDAVDSMEEASLRLASTARVSKVTLLTKDSFIFKIGDLHKDDLNRIENMYRKFLEDNGAV